MIRAGRITRITKEQTTSCAVTTGVKGYNQRDYDNDPRYKGGNGSYAHDFETEYHVMVYVTVYPTDDGLEGGKMSFDIRDTMKDVYGLQRISAQKLDLVKTNNEGRKIKFDYDPITKYSNIESCIIY